MFRLTPSVIDLSGGDASKYPGYEERGLIISVDLGQINDWTAITITERIMRPPTRHEYYSVKDMTKEFHLRHIERPPRGTAYPEIIERIAELRASRKLYGIPKTIVIDLTGVGRPVWDEMQKTFYRNMYAISITGGNVVTKPETDIFNVPKRDLISALQVGMQNGDYKIAKGIPLSDVLVKEMSNFRVKITTSGHDQYEAWREGDHDDIVLSAAMGAWLAQQRIRMYS